MLARPLLRALLPLAAVVSFLAPAPVHAHDVPAASAATIQGEFHASLSDAETKLVELAEATPPGKFDWSPGKGVRPTAGVFMHVAAANFLIPSLLSHAPPAGVKPFELEASVKQKEAVVKMLRESFAFAHAAIDSTSDLDTRIDMFGKQVTKRHALLQMVSHAHEHLGQSIAYARSNGMTPPWTAREEAAAAAAAAAKKK
ncbi:MAG: DinB family protein [Candidatus Eisenbacteria bacterium]